MDYTSEIIQLVPRENYTVLVNFCDNSLIATYEVGPKLNQGAFQTLKNVSFLSIIVRLRTTLLLGI